MAKVKKDEAQPEAPSLVTDIIAKPGTMPELNVPDLNVADLNVTGLLGTASQTAVAYAYMPALFTLPAIHGLSHGVLRRHFSGKTNQVPDWVLGKLGLDGTGAPLPDTSRLANLRWDVLLPADVSDNLYRPVALCKLYEQEANDRQKDLVIHCKLLIDGDQPLHQWWEAARAFANETLAMAHHLAVVMVLHDPPATGYVNAAPPHIHLMAPARGLSVRGFRETSVLARDQAHQMLADAWKDVRQQRNL